MGAMTRSLSGSTVACVMPVSEASAPQVRLTGILVEGGRLLVERQVLRERANWNLPGGRLELGETLAECLCREMLEETGLLVEPVELLYVCDRFKSLDRQVVDMSFRVRRIGGRLVEGPHVDGEGECFAAVRMVPVEELTDYGFSSRFAGLVRQGFPDKGSYQGEFHRFYG
jgi:ADP-ribose pyrophosphatase YjhB (NUDIX family)